MPQVEKAILYNYDHCFDDNTHAHTDKLSPSALTPYAAGWNVVVEVTTSVEQTLGATNSFLKKIAVVESKYVILHPICYVTIARMYYVLLYHIFSMKLTVNSPLEYVNSRTLPKKIDSKITCMS